MHVSIHFHSFRYGVKTKETEEGESSPRGPAAGTNRGTSSDMNWLQPGKLAFFKSRNEAVIYYLENELLTNLN